MNTLTERVSEQIELPWVDLDLEEVGLKLILSILISNHLRHAYPSSTAEGYLSPTTPEGKFVRDVISRERTETLIQRWFGGPGEAGKLTVALLEMDIKRKTRDEESIDGSFKVVD